MGGRFMPVVVYFALGKSVHVDLVRRYPLRIRRSLEACGFDLGRTTSELFGIEMKWSENRNLPEYLLLVSGFLYDWETPIC